ncbi:cytochrome c oxidase assembly protein (heme A: farnesyltransferase), putative [Plasmodium vivax]|uniref:Heme O synthase n=4 Tax=Plasmodium vivax TaxID=5855 RepID=A5K9G5_PLAVS|nr:cytochrome c oxidase assembly protein (heme A: farnesyltransferase), putative [Plasmodium vivax]EDL44037.1 cytochrome c oxidase assembly protein (heme A: farnesyltransferase), putative [Plasmodium vivax]KMZ86266.1 farnesyltransferase [Plasmodium vivax Brazil I]KMZ92625.1 farnesyltransferase [Plasmodium vivax Mauritania I]SCO67706.1 cytochrome c oxidase assembly protein (heme A: farnesyltransferase), putative [Plasmodium vivax]|eukprot:XP_001613764.1 cytochrome c oxidase assembly protein (heme A: farnesyltransferase) [Plasmodium vivax Sal-1]
MLGRGCVLSMYVGKKEFHLRGSNFVTIKRPCRMFSCGDGGTYNYTSKGGNGHTGRKATANRSAQLRLVHLYRKYLSLDGGGKTHHGTSEMVHVMRVHTAKMVKIKKAGRVEGDAVSVAASIQVEFGPVNGGSEANQISEANQTNQISEGLTAPTGDGEKRGRYGFPRTEGSPFCGAATAGEFIKRGEQLQEANDGDAHQKGSTPLGIYPHLSSYLELSKSKLTLWVTISSTFGYFMLGGSTITEFASLAMGVYLCSSSANTFNQIIERDIDKVMQRTKRRPLVCNRNRISLRNAKLFGALTAITGSAMLYHLNNPLTAILGVVNILLYACVYTPLKRRTPYNTHVGSIVGSIPTLMGCTAVAQNLLAPEPWILFITQLLWQFPHFYSIAYLYKEDYSKGKYKMFPLEDNQNGLYTAKLCRPYLILLSSLPFLFFFCGYTSYMYILTSLLPNVYIFYKFQAIFRNPSKGNIRSFFKHSLWHIILLLALSSYHTQIPDNSKRGGETGAEQVDGGIPRSEAKPEELADTPEYAITKFKKRLLKFCIVFS